MIKKKIIFFLFILNLIGVAALYFSPDRTLGIFCILLCIIFSLMIIAISYSSKDSDDEIFPVKNRQERRPFINELTTNNKRLIYTLGWMMAFIPALLFNSKDLAFLVIFALNLWFILILLCNTYFALSTHKFIEVPIKSISVDIEDIGELGKSNIHMDVRYQYEIDSIIYTSYKIRYPFWFVTDKRKRELAKKIKMNSVNCCYVNPENSKQAVLIKGFELQDIPWFFIYTVFGLLSLLAYLIN